MGILSAQSGVFSKWTELFGTDYPRVIGDIATFGADHFRTSVHPLFVLFLNPPGFVLKFLTGSPFIAAVLLTSLFGVLTALLSYFVFKKTGFTEIQAVTFTLFLSFSSSHLFFSASPESWIFSAFGLVLLFLLLVIKHKSSVIRYLASLFSFGIVTTNIIHVFILNMMKFVNRSKFKKTISSSARFVTIFIVAAVLLSLSQKIIYPSSKLFFLPKSYQGERAFTSQSQSMKQIVHRIILEGENFCFYNVIAPIHHVQDAQRYAKFSDRILASSTIVSFEIFSIFRYANIFGYIAFFLWCLLFLYAIYAFWLYKLYKQKIVCAALLCLGAHFGIHFFYGYPEELFLYSINSTFFLVFLTGLSMSHLFRQKNKIVYLLSAVLIISTLINNLHFFLNSMILQSGGHPTSNFFQALYLFL